MFIIVAPLLHTVSLHPEVYSNLNKAICYPFLRL